MDTNCIIPDSTHIIANPSRFVNRPAAGRGPRKRGGPAKRPPQDSSLRGGSFGRYFGSFRRRAFPFLRDAYTAVRLPPPGPVPAGRRRKLAGQPLCPRPAQRDDPPDAYASGKAGCVRAAKRSCMGGEAPGPVCARPGGEGTATRRLPRRNRHRTRQGTCKSSKSSGCCPFCPGSAGRGISSVPPCGRTGRRWGR